MSPLSAGGRDFFLQECFLHEGFILKGMESDFSGRSPHGNQVFLFLPQQLRSPRGGRGLCHVVSWQALRRIHLCLPPAAHRPLVKGFLGRLPRLILRPVINKKATSRCFKKLNGCLNTIPAARRGPALQRRMGGREWKTVSPRVPVMSISFRGKFIQGIINSVFVKNLAL